MDFRLVSQTFGKLRRNTHNPPPSPHARTDTSVDRRDWGPHRTQLLARTIPGDRGTVVPDDPLRGHRTLWGDAGCGRRAAHRGSGAEAAAQ